MKSRLPVVALAVLLSVLLGLLAFILGTPVAAVVVAGAIGFVVGGVLGQSLLWLRSSAGRVARIEHSTTKRLEDMRAIAEKRHEILFRATREARERATSAEREAKRAASLLPRAQEVAKEQRADLREMRLSIIDRVDDQVVLLEDYMQLMRLVPMPLPMPRPGTWAASEDLLLWLAGFVLGDRPRTVVDLGSGQSSVWMAGAMREAGYEGRVIGVDHDERYAEATRELGRRQGVEAWLTVVHAPLVDVEVDGRASRWYDPAALADIRDIDLLSVDGPPGQGLEQARWAALPLLRDQLSPGATIVLDDLIRRDEQEILEDWLDRLPGCDVERFDFEKGAAVLRLR
jgi:predicted O-methyltransferase YrrM